jgi:hypothetical protein
MAPARRMRLTEVVPCTIGRGAFWSGGDRMPFITDECPFITDRNGKACASARER